ncbi:MAG: hypothetical protein A2Y25_04490 [Candidatus Melainabacteria bacterium GWF2_37_15]|nr:MAG: hypothetical protein A2Y25_04490 [Candidatus Melainabacteria bacterium GWF2_37_15]
MPKNLAKNGLSLIELIIVCMITGVLLLSTAEISSRAFEAQVGHNLSTRAKQNKNAISERISSKVKEAVKAYYSPLTVSIPFEGYVYSLNAEQNCLAVLIPKFDEDGDFIQPSAGTTTFTGVAFSIVLDPEEDDGTYVLIETNAEFDLATSLSDPLAISVPLPSDWSGGESFVLADNLSPGNFTNLGGIAFDVKDPEKDTVDFAFVPYGGNVYFPSPTGTVNINDSDYLTRCQFRNYRI